MKATTSSMVATKRDKGPEGQPRNAHNFARNPTPGALRPVITIGKHYFAPDIAKASVPFDQYLTIPVFPPGDDRNADQYY